MSDASVADQSVNQQPSQISAEADWRDYFDLLKPRVMSLVIFTGAAGLVAAPGTMHPVMAIAAIILLAIGAGASGALNMWYDADIDAEMARTMQRPIPKGAVTAGDALGIGTALSFFSVALMGLLINVTAAVLLAITIAFYLVIYTMWLKRRTPQNIVIGGAAGAFPPVIGWAAVTGTVTLESLVLFGIIFLWTPAHFWALSLFISKDYERVSVPMLPVVKGVQHTRNQIIAYTLLTAVFGVLPYFMGYAGIAYAIVAGAAGMWFSYLALKLWRGAEGYDRKTFFFSIFYLFIVFAMLMGERLVAKIF